jgi:hypothetical protein
MFFLGAAHAYEPLSPRKYSPFSRKDSGILFHSEIVLLLFAFDFFFVQDILGHTSAYVSTQRVYVTYL